jgi:drug/metabolite transporter (DMT)-like permease
LKQISIKEPSKSLVIAAFAAVYIIWGSTYIGILLAIKSIPPFLMAGTRFFAAGFILYIWCLVKGEKTPDINSISKNSFSGTMMLFCGTTTLIWAEQYLPSGLCAIIIASIPLWFVLLDKKYWTQNFSDKFIIIGLLIGFAGIILLFSGKGTIDLLHNEMQLISFVALLIGSILWSVGSFFSKYVHTSGSTSMKASIQMMAAGIAAFVTSFIAGEYHHFEFSQITSQSFYAILYLIFFGSLIGYIAYIWLLSVRPASIVGTYAYVNPAVAMFLGWLIAGENISLTQIIALFVILSGVLLVNFSKYKK